MNSWSSRAKALLIGSSLLVIGSGVAIANHLSSQPKKEVPVVQGESTENKNPIELTPSNPPSSNLELSPQPENQTPSPVPEPSPEPSTPAEPNCDPNYSPCVPNVSYDLDCPDIGFSVSVLGSDPHGFDRDGDGYGCESY